jgi:glutaredoxin-like YruB-family protein
MKDVTIYSTSSCHYCTLAKEYFKSQGIAYTEHNVGTDIEKRKEMIELTGQMGVPVIRIGDQIAVGFQESAIAQMLAA